MGELNLRRQPADLSVAFAHTQIDVDEQGVFVFIVSEIMTSQKKTFPVLLQKLFK